MATSTKRRSAKHAIAQKQAAREAEEAAKALRSFAATLKSLYPSGSVAVPPTPRNWWRLQAGRFKNDPTFADFLAQIQAARRHEG